MSHPTITIAVTQFQTTVRRVAESLGKSFEMYWPADEDGKNDPEEKNLSFHFAHVFLTDGFSVFAEANHPRLNHRGLDLLAISGQRDFFVACEFKRHKSPGNMSDSLDDLNRVASFRLNNRLRIGRVGATTIETLRLCQRGFGLVAGLNWRGGPVAPRLADSSSQPTFAQQVNLLAGTIGEPELVRHWDCAEVRGAYYIQYAFFPTWSEGLA